MKTERTSRTEAAEGAEGMRPGSPDAPDPQTTDPDPDPAAGPESTDHRPAHRRDLIAAAAGVLLITAAILIGHALQNRTGTLQVQWPPLLASWDPHLGPGTPAALTLAVLVVAYGPRSPPGCPGAGSSRRPGRGRRPGSSRWR